MSKVKGKNFRAFVGGLAAANAVPEETNCQVTITGNTENTDTKDTEGLFTKNTIVSKSWQVQVDDYDADATSLKAVVTQFKSATAQTVGWDQTTNTAGSMNRTPASANFKRSGSALLTDVTMQFNDRQTVSVSLQFQGSGALN